MQWNHDFAYAIGLITTDGNLSPDGRHINLTSKDEEIILIKKDDKGNKSDQHRDEAAQGRDK